MVTDGDTRELSSTAAATGRLSAADEELLVRCVERGLALREAGGDIDLARLCADHPHLIPAAAEALGLEAMLPRVQDQGRDPLAGRVLQERYRLSHLVGLGAMGAVYQAEDISLHRRVAVKVLQPGFFRTEERVARFVREAQVLARLQHENVVPIHDHGTTDDGLHFLVMDLLEGVPLSRVLQELHSLDRLPASTDALGADLGLSLAEKSYVRQVVRWGAELAAGLGQAHQAGVFHRDVKPSNVFITTSGRALLLDFGIAAREDAASLTATGTSLGTPWYMAPEQAARGQKTQPTVDIYGLCASLYHLLTRHPPLDGEPAEVLVKLQTEDPVPPQKLEPQLPKDLCAIVEKGMEKSPFRRYGDMADLAQDLNAFLDHRPVVARPLSAAGRSWRRFRRRPARALAAASASVVLVLTAVLVPLWSSVQAAEWNREYRRLVSRLPALLAFEAYPEQRLLQDRSERGESLAQLDRILEIRPDDVASRLLRAALLLDGGQHEPARADLARIAASHDSPYLRSVVDCYQRVDSSRAGVDAVVLKDLPEPRTAMDCFVAGFHALRGRRDIPAAHLLLTRAADSYLPARDLRLLTGLGVADQTRDRDQRRKLFQSVHDEALGLEAIYGQKTARTRHAVGTARIGLLDYQGALEPLKEALALRPNRHGPLQNLGIVYRRLGELDEAEECLRAAHRLRPWLWNTLHTLAQVQWERGDYEGAMDLARQIPAQGSLGEAWRRPYLIGCVHLQRGFADLRMQRDAEAREQAAHAQEHLELSARNGAPTRYTGLQLALAQAIQAGDHLDLLVVFLKQLHKDRSNPRCLQNVAALLPPSELPRSVVDLLREYLLLLASDLAPGDPEPRRQLETMQGNQEDQENKDKR